MHILLDKMAATLVGGAVILALVVLQVRVQQTTTQRTMHYGTKKQMLAFGDVLQRDMTNAGHEAKPSDQIIRAHEDDDDDGVLVTRTFEYQGIDADGNQVIIRYELEKVGEQEVEGAVMPLFRWSRTEGGTPAGQSPATLTGFRIELLDESGNTTADFDDVRRLRVSASSALWRQEGVVQTLPQMHWGVTLVPDGLDRQGYQGGV